MATSKIRLMCLFVPGWCLKLIMAQHAALSTPRPPLSPSMIGASWLLSTAQLSHCGRDCDIQNLAPFFEYFLIATDHFDLLPLPDTILFSSLQHVKKNCLHHRHWFVCFA